MVTTVSKTIKTGGDYSTPQAWNDAVNGTSLVTANQIWQGLLGAQTFSSSTPSAKLLNVSGATTSAACYKELKADVGCGFMDLIGSGALNLVSGAATLSATGNYATAIYVAEQYFRLSRVQATAVYAGLALDGGTAGVMDVNQCIFVAPVNDGVVHLYGPQVIRNSLIINTTAGSARAIFFLQNGATAINVTAVATGSPATQAFLGYSAGTVAKNCAFFNVSAVWSSGSTPTFTTCFTDASSPPTGCTTTAYSTTTGAKFKNLTSGSYDFRIQSGSSLIDAGTTDSTNAATDILGTARPQGTAYDVGCFEFASGGSVYNLSQTESGSAADTTNGPALYGVAVTESGAGADVPSASALFVAAASDALSGSDTPSAVLTSPQTVAESGTAADTLSGTQQALQLIAESGTAADTPSGALVSPQTVAESGSAADTPASVALFQAATSEALSGADTSNGLKLMTATTTESGTAADTLSGTQQAVQAVFETLAATDTVSAAALFQAALTDALSAADATSGAGMLLAALTESGAATDVVALLGSQATVTVAESGSAADVYTSTVAFQGAMTELLAATDAVNAQSILASVIADALNALAVTSASSPPSNLTIGEVGALLDTVTASIIVISGFIVLDLSTPAAFVIDVSTPVPLSIHLN